MSELQISLLVIGIIAVLSVYGYNLWQQRQYRKRYGSTFQKEGEDALYHAPIEKPSADIAGTVMKERVFQTGPAPLASRSERRRWPRECGLLGEVTDYIAVLSFKIPANAKMLAPLWQQRFDFRKNVCVCGLNTLTRTWEKVIAESPLSYSAFKLALQLADRSGAASDARLEDFRSLARDIATQQEADVELPDVAVAATRAQELDAFCAEVDQIVGLNILPNGSRIFFGSEVLTVAAQHGLVLQANGAFQLQDARGFAIFSLNNYDNEPFRQEELSQMQVNGLTLLLDVPCVELPAKRFDEMAVLAQQMAVSLQATVVDDRRIALGESGIAHIRDQVAAIENRMQAYSVTPGSPQARRLFS